MWYIYITIIIPISLFPLIDYNTSFQIFLPGLPGYDELGYPWELGLTDW